MVVTDTSSISTLTNMSSSKQVMARQRWPRVRGGGCAEVERGCFSPGDGAGGGCSRDPLLRPWGQLRMSLRALRTPSQPLHGHRKTCLRMAGVMGIWAMVWLCWVRTCLTPGGTSQVMLIPGMTSSEQEHPTGVQIELRRSGPSGLCCRCAQGEPTWVGVERRSRAPMRPDFPQPVNLYHVPGAGAGVRQDLSWFKSGV